MTKAIYWPSSTERGRWLTFVISSEDLLTLIAERETFTDFRPRRGLTNFTRWAERLYWLSASEPSPNTNFWFWHDAERKYQLLLRSPQSDENFYWLLIRVNSAANWLTDFSHSSCSLRSPCTNSWFRCSSKESADFCHEDGVREDLLTSDSRY